MGKLGSWFLLMLISYVMVSAVNRPRGLEASAAIPGRIGRAR